MAVTCPAGHISTSTDYCDTCGAAIQSEPAAPIRSVTDPPAVPDTGVISPCPNCGAPAGVDDAFCEVCGIDFATGELPTQPHKVVEAAPTDPAAVVAAAADPAPAPADPAAIVAAAADPALAPPAAAAPVGWSVVIEADRAFYEGNESPDVALPFPSGAAARELPLKSGEALVGRRSDSRGVYPDVDLHEDPGVSRRHALLRHKPDDSWVVIDQGSTNGTRVSGATSALTPGEERPLLNGDQLLLGAWTRITLKRST